MSNAQVLELLKPQITASKEVILEVKAGEGGDDSKLFAVDLFAALSKFLTKSKCQINLTSASQGHLVAIVEGAGLWELLSPEIGVHCVQRIPPTETKNRRHTSYLSVALLPINSVSQTQIPGNEIEVKTQRGHGPGGQHQNKTDSAVRMFHKPSGIKVFVNGRDQHANRRKALKILVARVHDARLQSQNGSYLELRKHLFAANGRGQKIRTYNFMNDRAVDHRTGKKVSLKRVIDRGSFNLLRS